MQSGNCVRHTNFFCIGNEIAGISFIAQVTGLESYSSMGEVIGIGVPATGSQ